MQSFETYYKGLQTNHHKELKWNFSMGTCVLTCKIPGATKTYELIVSAYQMCILYLFNFHEKLTLDEITEQMGFDQETAKKNMQSLANFKPARILKLDNGQYFVNRDFKPQLRRVTFPIPVLEELVKREKVTQDRSHSVDALIVRIMKSRKKLRQPELIGECISMCKNFRPELTMINKRIESLIERDYLMRDKGDEQTLLYKA